MVMMIMIIITIIVIKREREGGGEIKPKRNWWPKIKLLTTHLPMLIPVITSLNQLLPVYILGLDVLWHGTNPLAS